MSGEEDSYEVLLSKYSSEELAVLEKEYGPMTEEKLRFLEHFSAIMNKVSDFNTLLKEYDGIDQSDSHKDGI